MPLAASRPGDSRCANYVNAAGEAGLQPGAGDGKRDFSFCSCTSAEGTKRTQSGPFLPSHRCPLQQDANFIDADLGVWDTSGSQNQLPDSRSVGPRLCAEPEREVSVHCRCPTSDILSVSCYQFSVRPKTCHSVQTKNPPSDLLLSAHGDLLCPAVNLNPFTHSMSTRTGCSCNHGWCGCPRSPAGASTQRKAQGSTATHHVVEDRPPALGPHRFKSNHLEELPGRKTETGCSSCRNCRNCQKQSHAFALLPQTHAFEVQVHGRSPLTSQQGGCEKVTTCPRSCRHGAVHARHCDTTRVGICVPPATAPLSCIKHLQPCSLQP